MQLNSVPSTVMPLTAVTFDLLTRKPNQYVSWPTYICDLILFRLVPLITKISYSPDFSGHCLLWSWTLTISPQNIISISMNLSTLSDQKLVKFPWLVFDRWCSQGFWDTQTHRYIHRLTHTQTDTLKNSMPPVPKVFSGGATKMCLYMHVYWGKTLMT